MGFMKYRSGLLSGYPIIGQRSEKPSTNSIGGYYHFCVEKEMNVQSCPMSFGTVTPTRCNCNHLTR